MTEEQWRKLGYLINSASYCYASSEIYNSNAKDRKHDPYKTEGNLKLRDSTRNRTLDFAKKIAKLMSEIDK